MEEKYKICLVGVATLVSRIDKLIWLLVIRFQPLRSGCGTIKYLG